MLDNIRGLLKEGSGTNKDKLSVTADAIEMLGQFIGEISNAETA